VAKKISGISKKLTPKVLRSTKFVDKRSKENASILEEYSDTWIGGFGIEGLPFG